MRESNQSCEEGSEKPLLDKDVDSEAYVNQNAHPTRIPNHTYAQFFRETAALCII